MRTDTDLKRLILGARGEGEKERERDSFMRFQKATSGSSLGSKNGNPPTRAGREIRRPGGSLLERAGGPWVVGFGGGQLQKLSFLCAFRGQCFNSWAVA